MDGLKRLARRRLQPWSRRRKLRYAATRLKDWHARSVLLIGVHPNPAAGFDNLIELGLQQLAPRCVAVGLEETESASMWRDYRVADGLDLPFADREFDVAYSNAVVEHVGGEAEQRRFIAEMDRVARHWIATTPNRWFPIELHSYRLLSHWRPRWHDHDAPPGVTRLLGRRDLRAIVPRGRIRGAPGAPTLTAVSD